MKTTTIAAVAGLMSVVVPVIAQESEYRNLQVLPADIARDELGAQMIENLRGLGLPRLAGEGCLYCHVGDLETPRSQWDYASDAKPMKETARVMMRMVKAINDQHLASLATRIDPSFRVTCSTCHSGRTDPRPLPAVLWTDYESGGIDAVTAKYRALRERYFGSGAYDFREGVLTAVAIRMADQGGIDDAIALAALNAGVHPEVTSAKRAWVALKLERTIDEKGVDAALAELAAMEATLAPDVVTPGLLNRVAWRLNRTGREVQGHALIAANLAKFPNEYVAVESMVFILADSDRKEEAIAMLERWLDENPDHARARRLLVNLRAE